MNSLNPNIELLRFSTMGSVDDGKSTLIGRMLVDCQAIYQDQLATLSKVTSEQKSPDGFTLSLATDSLSEEMEQGITIDVAYRYFTTPRRRFILADSPGHEQYTRNMATGASTANLSILVVDARKGLLTQSKRHAFIASLLGVPRLLMAINKMDLVDYSSQRFTQLTEEFSQFARKLEIQELRFIPISALYGDNVVRRSTQMAWYRGETILDYLENVYIAGDINRVDLRCAIQAVIRPHEDYRGYAGFVFSGSLRLGEEILVLPSMQKSRIKSLDSFTGSMRGSILPEVEAPTSVSITLETDLDISRGDMIVRPLNVPSIKTSFEAMLLWMSEDEMNLEQQYIILHATRETKTQIETVRYRVDPNTLHRLPAQPLTLNEIGRVAFRSASPLFLDRYQDNRATGGFILIDPISFHTVAAGMVIDRAPDTSVRPESSPEPFGPGTIVGVLHHEPGLISRQEREKRFGRKALTIWCTGLSGSGKSTLGRHLERRMFEEGFLVYHLDGDQIRSNLNSDLGFSKIDRHENIRRVAEVARHFNNAGISVICSLISPYRLDRENARAIIGRERFIELYLSTPLAQCEERDPHGLYKKARSGLLPEFTGVSAPYEAPESPDLTIDTSAITPEDAVEMAFLLVDDKSR